MPMIRKSGMSNRVADLRIDAAAREGARAVRSAGNDRATERFLNRYLDYLHETDNDRLQHDVEDARRRRRRQRAG